MTKLLTVQALRWKAWNTPEACVYVSEKWKGLPGTSFRISRMASGEHIQLEKKNSLSSRLSERFRQYSTVDSRHFGVRSLSGVVTSELKE